MRTQYPDIYWVYAEKKTSHAQCYDRFTCPPPTTIPYHPHAHQSRSFFSPNEGSTRFLQLAFP